MVRSGVIGCVFDFDDTLVPDSTTQLLLHHGVDATKFWTQDVRTLVEQGYDPTLAWLTLLLDLTLPGQPMAGLSNEALRHFGSQLDAQLFPGVATLFSDLRTTVSRFRDLSIEFYIVSGGLRQIILGSPLVAAEFSGVYGCDLAEDVDGVLRYIKRCVTFTEKTRYLFEINKGIHQVDAERNPYLVNKKVPQTQRRVPFEQMIYVGDGLTDIPCFSLVEANGGIPLGVFDPSEEAKAKRALSEFLQPHRVVSMHSPRYGPAEDLGAILRAAVASLCTTIEVRGKEAYGTS